MSRHNYKTLYSFFFWGSSCIQSIALYSMKLKKSNPTPFCWYGGSQAWFPLARRMHVSAKISPASLPLLSSPATAPPQVDM